MAVMGVQAIVFDIGGRAGDHPGPQRARPVALACARLAVEPARTVFLDDSERCVEGARQAGIHAVLYRNNAQASTDIEALLDR
jgi:putative hydrolase of the HAD superfamily